MLDDNDCEYLSAKYSAMLSNGPEPKTPVESINTEFYQK